MAGADTIEEVFSDTCVLLDFVQQDAGQAASTELIETDAVQVLVSDAVMDELATVTDRRKDIYADLIDFILGSEGCIVDYDPQERHVYVGENDKDHILNLQMDLRDIEDDREVLRRLRQYVRGIKRRQEYLEEKLADQVVVSYAPLPLQWDIQDIIKNGDDAYVVIDAAGWSADGGSGIFVTRDSGDILEYREELAEFLREEQGPDWVLQIYEPETVLSDLAVSAD